MIKEALEAMEAMLAARTGNLRASILGSSHGTQPSASAQPLSLADFVMIGLLNYLDANTRALEPLRQRSRLRARRWRRAVQASMAATEARVRAARRRRKAWQRDLEPFEFPDASRRRMRLIRQRGLDVSEVHMAERGRYVEVD